MKKINRVGETNRNFYGTLMKIIEYNGARDIVIEFQDEYKVRRKGDYKEFKNGCFKNPYDKSILDVGFLGEGKYNWKDSYDIYEVWKSMLIRCYDPYYINKEPTYKDCYVCDEWHNFQNFAKWYEENYYEVKEQRMCLDKDILNKGNKIYSPETCIFVPSRINILFTKRQRDRGEYPIGVGYREKYNNLQSRCCTLNGRVSLGIFPLNRPFQAFYTYKQFKENYIKQVADEYKDLIPKELYDAMYKYEVEIND